jgi:transposase
VANQNKGSSYSKVAKHFGVSASSVQFWEKHGFDRDWSTEEQEAWRKTYTKDRLVDPPLLQKKKDKAKPAKTAEPVLDYKEARTQKLAKEIERLSIIIGREKGELVPAAEMRETATRVVSVWCSELDALVGDLPGQLAGLTEAEIQPKLRNRIELLKANAREGFASL